jgi:CubicO group peptidase (beta-lactamase class C family)
MSAAVESAARQPFLTFMEEQVFQPLGMDHTGAESATEENPERVGEEEEDPPIATFVQQVVLKPLGIVDSKAVPATAPATDYLPGFGPNPLVRYRLHLLPPRNLSCYAGSMAFLSTPSDLVRLGLAINTGKLLQPATVQLLHASQQLASGEETGHGLGWDLGTLYIAGKGKSNGEATHFVGRDGEFQGHKMTSFLIFPKTGIVIALTSNASYADTPALARKVAEAFASSASQ